MIFEGSRYERSDVLRIHGVNTVVPTPATVVRRTYQDYVVIQGDRIDKLAARFLGDASLWWQIAQATPSWVFYGQLTPGITLRIPVRVRPS